MSSELTELRYRNMRWANFKPIDWLLPNIFDITEVLLNIRPCKGDFPPKFRLSISFQDGTIFECSSAELQKSIYINNMGINVKQILKHLTRKGRIENASRKFDSGKVKSRSTPISYAYLGLYNSKSPKIGYLSVRKYNENLYLSINFKEYDFKHSKDYVNECISALNKIGFIIDFQKYYLSPLVQMDIKNCDILCACIDIRNFSSFCSKSDIESIYVAKIIYMFRSLIHDIFDDTMYSMAKTLGDGMLLVWTKDETGNLQSHSKLIIERLGILYDRYVMQAKNTDNFPYDFPTELGIGLARGYAAQIEGDFIGRPLNLATRLCDKARPNGIVVDSKVNQEFSPDTELWEKKEMVLKGFEPRTLWIRKFTKEQTPSLPTKSSPVNLSDIINISDILINQIRDYNFSIELYNKIINVLKHQYYPGIMAIGNSYYKKRIWEKPSDNLKALLEKHCISGVLPPELKVRALFLVKAIRGEDNQARLLHYYSDRPQSGWNTYLILNRTKHPNESEELFIENSKKYLHQTLMVNDVGDIIINNFRAEPSGYYQIISVKNSPGSGGINIYIFLLYSVEIKNVPEHLATLKPFIPPNEDAKYKLKWFAIKEMEKDQNIARYNSDVLDGISSLFGTNLESLPDSFITYSKKAEVGS